MTYSKNHVQTEMLYIYRITSHKLRKLLDFSFILTMNKEGTKEVKKLNQRCTASMKV